MALGCLIGMHKWSGCKCTACGKTRDEGHDWSKNCEKCVRCSAAAIDSHKWDGCRCSVCGIRRLRNHKWNGCECSACGKTRDEQHDWSKDCEKCARCGTTRANVHDWEGPSCRICHKSRFAEVEKLTEWLHKGDWADRRAAVVRLGELGGPVELLIKSLADCDGAVNGPAAEALAKLGADRIIESLVKALRDEPYNVYHAFYGTGCSHQVPEAAAKFLGDLGDARAIEPLRKLLSEDSPLGHDRVSSSVVSEALAKLATRKRDSSN